MHSCLRSVDLRAVETGCLRYGSEFDVRYPELRPAQHLFVDTQLLGRRGGRVCEIGGVVQAADVHRAEYSAVVCKDDADEHAAIAARQEVGCA